MKIWKLAVALSILMPVGAQAGDSIPFPEGYTHWHHVKTLVLKPGHTLYDNFGGIHHVYANDKAFESMTKEKTYPKGSILVFDLFKAEDSETALAEGERKFVGVMKKVGGRQLDGWRYEVFAGPNLQPQRPKGESCHACHMQAKDRDFVFSSFMHGH